MSVIGLESGIVRLVSYSPEWKQLFAGEKERLKGAVGNNILDIQHVGSTAIPGMIAKPIIDIAIAVRDFEQAKECIGPIEMLGYEYRGEQGIPRRHYFVLGDPRRFHLHVNEIDSKEWNDLILFRDALIEDRVLAEAYAKLKIDLARRFSNDREAYLSGKAAFIEQVLDAAGSAR